MDNNHFLINIGLNIKAIRKSKKLSQQDLAARCNIEKANMSRIEAGKSNLTLKTLLKIAQALEVKVHHIVDIDR